MTAETRPEPGPCENIVLMFGVKHDAAKESALALARQQDAEMRALENILLDEKTERDMAEAYYKDLEREIVALRGRQQPFKNMVRHTCTIHSFQWAHERVCPEAGCPGACVDCTALASVTEADHV